MVDDVEFRSHVIVVQTLFDTHLHQSVKPIPNREKRKHEKRTKKTNARD